MSKRSLATSISNSNPPRQQAVGVERSTHVKTKGADDNQKTQLCNASDPSYEDNWPTLSSRIVQGKSKRKGGVHSLPKSEAIPQLDIAKGSRDDHMFPDNNANSGRCHHKSRPPKIKIDLGTQIDQRLNERSGLDGLQEEEAALLRLNSDRKGSDPSPPIRRDGNMRSSHWSKQPRESESSPEIFDICFKRGMNHPFLNPTLSFDDISKYIEFDPSIKGDGHVLRPGMVLLKRYIPLTIQVNIAMRCRELGIGVGGFYRPGFKDGAKLNLYMMCLGKDWDPQTKKYGKRRNFDNAISPDIPTDFNMWVEKALHDSQELIKQESKRNDVDEILPIMNPDICIVNFYTKHGRLGLHQDRDESKKSISRGLPVVSFSIGDSAEFLYGEKRDVEKAERVLLESGDVLIFGGDSRQIFHGVASVLPYTAPMVLAAHANLRPGRLNLTFRKY